MKIAIHQPSYAPWCGYFAKIAYADAFIYLDDAQMSKNNLINRNKIDAGGMEKWLTVPVSFSLGDAINQTTFADSSWGGKHKAMLSSYYRKAPFFREVMEALSAVYDAEHGTLADVNMVMTEAVCKYVGLARTFYRASALNCPGKADDRLVALVRRVGGSTYVSGPGGMLYQDPAKFAVEGLALAVMSYTPIPYAQPHEVFLPRLSVLDALFQMGPAAVSLMRYL